MTYKNIVISNELKNKASETLSKSFLCSKKDEDIFYHACFCILAPQAKFNNNLFIVDKLKEFDFYNKFIDLNTLSNLCKKSRFYNMKAKRLLSLKDNFKLILSIVHSDNLTVEEKRSWLAKNVNGFGLKASSHFLRNLGYSSIAILDTHIFKFIECKPPKSSKEYYNIEKIFISIANKLHLSAAELDLIVWKHYAKISWDNYVY